MSFIGNVKRLLIGRPIHTKHAHNERLNVPFGLAVFASDALSSVAYATEEVLLVLVLAGSLAAYNTLTPIALVLSLLLVIVAFSYYQTIHAYPDNGGTYIVSTDNLGPLAGQFAGAALLVDYVLTVAVSISAGVQAVISINHGVQPYAVPIACAAVAFLCLMNLRGAKESGLVFAIPTFGFVILVAALIARSVFTGLQEPHSTPVLPQGDGMHDFGLFLVLRGFTASCTALTGTEAIANGVKAFKSPEAKNASRALIMMVVMLGTMFIGISWAAWHAGIVPKHMSDPTYQTVLAQIAEQEFGRGWFYAAILIATAAILFLAANTAFADFPRLASFIGRDGYLPRQLSSLGDRLVYQNGIIVLAIVSILLIVKFNADPHKLIPLYALGVFVAFTLSQAGMAVHFLKKRKMTVYRHDRELAVGETLDEVAYQKRRRKLAIQMAISIVGAITTFVVACIIVVTKWEERVWIVVIAFALLMLIFRIVKGHYNSLAKSLSLSRADALPEMRSATLLLVPRLHRGILQAIRYAQVTADDCRALHVSLSHEQTAKVKDDWGHFGADMPLVILESPYRSLVSPLTDYIDEMQRVDKNLMVTVIVPQAVPKHWWQGLLHNNAAIQLKLALGSRRNVVVTNVRYFIES